MRSNAEKVTMENAKTPNDNQHHGNDIVWNIMDGSVAVLTHSKTHTDT